MGVKPQHFGVSFPALFGLSYAFGTLIFREAPRWTDILVASLLYIGKSPPLKSRFLPLYNSGCHLGMYPENIEIITPISRTPTSRLMRSYLKTILSNPESRKIFYFLMLNLSYMMVQMLYGIWTNSLGLISDGETPHPAIFACIFLTRLPIAIHMAFDCMAIGVGLFASVMATWDPNERFTYG